MCSNEAEKELIQKISENEIFMVTNNHCPYCVKALHKIKTSLKVQKPYLFNLDKISQEEYIRYAPCFAKNDVISLPQIFFQGQYLGGYGELDLFIRQQKSA